ncbi:MAG: hypoxanthine phosphoribosyltransferase [Acidimicrobiia bacterium]|nr:hypoxanthine phosphoribosyltransferase [Acidimicrobiia bacterium]MYG57017.1 hypoxanthine phosphoribosyltransferase [Acidimicrobiia bacterium]MYJ31697.1 hypoxanthine phosphoribosyltransferase [Acidimicrobiia bacterium]
MNRADPELFASREAIEQAVERVAVEISQQCSDGVVLVSVLKGSLPFLADLVRAVDIEVEVDFMALSRFAVDSGRVRLVKDLDCDVGGRQVVLVEDIVDTGLSLGYLMGELRRRSAASVAVAALLNRSARRILPLEPDFVGFEAPDEFFLGYGLDWDGRYRNLDRLVIGDPGLLADDPDAYVSILY